MPLRTLIALAVSGTLGAATAAAMTFMVALGRMNDVDSDTRLEFAVVRLLAFGVWGTLCAPIMYRSSRRAFGLYTLGVVVACAVAIGIEGSLGFGGRNFLIAMAQPAIVSLVVTSLIGSWPQLVSVVMQMHDEWTDKDEAGRPELARWSFVVVGVAYFWWLATPGPTPTLVALMASVVGVFLAGRAVPNPLAVVVLVFSLLLIAILVTHRLGFL